MLNNNVLFEKNNKTGLLNTFVSANAQSFAHSLFDIALKISGNYLIYTNVLYSFIST